MACVIASSFARIFYRNSVNIGLPILECEEAVQAIEEGDNIQVDLEKGEIVNLRTGETYQAAPFPEFMQDIMAQGGLIGYVQHKKIKQ